MCDVNARPPPRVPGKKLVMVERASATFMPYKNRFFRGIN